MALLFCFSFCCDAGHIVNDSLIMSALNIEPLYSTCYLCIIEPRAKCQHTLVGNHSRGDKSEEKKENSLSGPYFSTILQVKLNQLVIHTTDVFWKLGYKKWGNSWCWFKFFNISIPVVVFERLLEPVIIIMNRVRVYFFLTESTFFLRIYYYYFKNCFRSSLIPKHLN